MYSVLVIIWQIVIFLFSAQPANVSSNISGGITKSVIKIFAPSINEHTLANIADSLSFAVRKSAHFFSYMLLCILMYNAVKKNNLIKHKKVSTIIFCFLYAISDEIHQYFVPGRACRVSDIFIDTCGILTSILIITLFINFKRKIRLKK